MIYCPLQSAYNGRGDRADPSTWPEVEGPLTVRKSSVCSWENSWVLFGMDFELPKQRKYRPYNILIMSK